MWSSLPTKTGSLPWLTLWPRRPVYKKGENYFDPQTKKWAKSGSEENRGFNRFILKPIYDLRDAIMGSNQAVISKYFEMLKIRLDPNERKLEGKALLKVAMRKWLPIEDTVLDMTVIHLPSPMVAQKYRMETLYQGPSDDYAAMAIRDTNARGDLMLYVSRLVFASDKQTCYAFGRVFSGTVRSNQKAHVQGHEYIPGEKTDVMVKNVEQAVAVVDHKIMPIDQVPAGNLVALSGIDQSILQTATVTDCETAYNFKTVKVSSVPVIQMSVEPKKSQDLPKLVESLKRLSKSDALISTRIDEDGKNIIGGQDEPQLELFLKNLEDDAGVEFHRSEPIVSYRETVTAPYSTTALSKSANKHNRLYMTTEPMDDELTVDIEAGKITAKDDSKTRARILADKYGWDITEARKIWAFGPAASGADLLVDTTKGVKYLDEIKDSVNAGFQWATRGGPLAGEPMRGIRFNIMDVTLHADENQRGGGQIIPTARRVINAAALLAEPCLQEPVYVVGIQVPEDAMGGVYSTLNKRIGHVFEENQRPGTPIFSIKAHLPVSESFGLAGDLRSQTSGQAIPTLVFDQWQPLDGSPLQKGSKVEQLVLNIRKRKGLKEEVPDYTEFNDKS